ncbi:hypothetical protein FPOAC2_09839 [Fusarium poae]|uniref:hypothetical protein n=1 Tax=Fusarium poae TaxID=36050 RepID=UPI001CE793C8|nr:hypothetical protein FPOAC1_009899 [Fusarium poae]KAG8670483.1 hypothetical protein FPOAC1_009899 [Fusarium poae]
MHSYSCQICGVDMAIARIRTPDEPPSAAWDIDGANYIGWTKGPWGDHVKDEECQDCTTADRTPADPQILHWESLRRWTEDDDSDDQDWMPAYHSENDNEPLEYDSECENAEGASSESGCNSIDPDSLNEDHDCVKDLYPVSELGDQLRPERLPNGTWYNNKVYYTGNRQDPIIGDFPGEGEQKVPPEHIASPSCQSLRGINGHRLSLEQMKNCRNVRFLIPKSRNDENLCDDKLMERGSLFCLSGESNGSNVVQGGHWVTWKSFYPPRHGIQELRCDWQMVNEGIHNSHNMYPLPVHSYCLDIYAKASYRALGKVDLDGIWHWREIESQLRHPHEKTLLNHPEVLRAREDWHLPWHHYTGSEWLVANPVEISDIHTVLDPCKDLTLSRETGQHQASILGYIPKEILYQIIDLLNPTDVNSVAKTCHMMYHFTQLRFREIVRKDMAWLWEILEDSQYPQSRPEIPDRPVTWDPLCPLGIPPPSFPVGLEKEEVEAELWEQIIHEYPEMEEISRDVKTANSKRRDEILEPYQVQLEVMSAQWLAIRAGVETWILGSQNNKIELDWGRTWRLLGPKATSLLPGVRNRARIWDRCQRILSVVTFRRKDGRIDKMLTNVLAGLTDTFTPGWSRDPEVDGW